MTAAFQDLRPTERRTIPAGAPSPRCLLGILALLVLGISGGASPVPSSTGGTSGADWDFHYEIAYPDLGDTTNDIAVADIDGDGRLDIITDKYLYWFKNPGKKAGQWERTQISGDSGENWWLGHWTGDFDGDGDQDVVSGHCADTYVYWFENLRGNGQRWARHRLAVHGDKWKDHIRSHDFNVDGRDDLIVQKYHGSGVYYLEAPKDPTGSWPTWRIGYGRAGVCLFDIDRDGDMDVCVENTWLENPGDPRQENWTAHTINDSIAGVKVAPGDLNGDGFIDLFHSSEEGKGIWYFLGPEDPRTQPWQKYELDAYRSHNHTCWLEDFDGDGDLDFLTAQMHQSAEDRVSIFENTDGTGTNWSEHVIGRTGSHNALAADINGDGRVDVVGKNWSQTNPIQIWYNEVSRDGLSAEQARRWRSAIRTTLFIPDPLPQLAVENYGRFEPTADVVAERVSYSTQFGMRVPAIVYSPREHHRELPALIIVNGHGGDKYSWYSFYSGILYAQAGAVVLTYDPIGEGERNRQRKSGTRTHDTRQEPRQMGQRLGGLMATDLMQAVSYLSQRADVDPERIGACGYSMGSFVLALTGAIEERLQACVLVGGGNIDGPDGYWDNSKPMCQGIPYQSLAFLGDRPAALYALHAKRGPMLVFNGLEDTVVAIPRRGKSLFDDLGDRISQLLGTREGIFEAGFVAQVSHRPFFVTEPVALWLERYLDFPLWTPETIRTMPTTHISEWVKAKDVTVDPYYASEDREGGVRALGVGVPGLSRSQLSVFTKEQWEQQKTRLIYETWVREAKSRIKESRAP